MVKKIAKLILIFVFFVFFLSFFFYFWLEKEIQTPLNKGSQIKKIFEIKKGESLTSVAERLEKEGIIKNKYLFLFYLWQKNKRKIIAGRYFLSPSESIPQIVEKLEKGKVVREEIAITFPEGMTLKEMEAKFKKELGRKVNLAKFKVKDFKNEFDFFEGVKENSSLEGFLFPDTYFFKKDQKDKEIVEKFLKNFDKKLSPFLRQEIKKQKKTIYEILIMASLIEKEARSFEEKRIVSGIFWERIKKNIPLESCATIAYILGRSWKNIEEMRKDISQARNIDSPYNTYKYPGLPPGPICNPGLDSIKAAIFPKFTEYKYFLVDPKTGKTIFSKTFEEHKKNKLKYFRK